MFSVIYCGKWKLLPRPQMLELHYINIYNIYVFILVPVGIIYTKNIVSNKSDICDKFYVQTNYFL